MAFVKAFGTSGGTGASVATASTAVAQDNTLVVGVSCDTGAGVPAITVTDGVNTFTQLGTTQNDATNNQCLALFIAEKITGGTRVIQANFSPSSNTEHIEVVEMSGRDAVSLDTGPSFASFASTTAPATAAFTPVGAGEDVVCIAVETTSGNTWTKGANYTLGENQGAQMHSEYRLGAPVSSQTADWTINLAASVILGAVTLKPLAAGSNLQPSTLLPLFGLRLPGQPTVSPPIGPAPGSERSAFDVITPLPITRFVNPLSLAMGPRLFPSPQPYILVTQGTGTTILLGIAIETDVVQPFSRLKTLTIGKALEIDLSQPLSRSKTRTMGVALETDLSQPLSRSKTKALGIALETDLAQTLSRAKSRVLGIATEIDLAQTLTATKNRVLGIVIETDLAKTLASTKSRVLGVASEIDLPQSFGRLKSRTLGIASEVDLAIHFAGGQVAAAARRARTIIMDFMNFG